MVDHLNADGGRIEGSRRGIQAGDGDYVFDCFGEDGLITDGDTDVVGTEAVLQGARLQVGMVRISPGADPVTHTHPIEQFTFVHRGLVRSRVGDVEETLSEASLIYAPAGTEHEIDVVGGEDAHLYCVGPIEPTDEAKPESLNEEVESTLLEANEDNVHFDLTAIEQRRSGSKYAKTIGFFIEAEQVQVGKMRFPTGHGADPHTHANEQFNLGLDGVADWVVDGVSFAVEPGHVNYVPPNAVHEARARDDGPWDFLAAKDTSYRAFGEPVGR